ncbi:hypothetical protein N7510_011606 [Penicillium lagena]|uniref:uncharacterized protein n=1 Tax=Penicillium lagena TaxID=94218 RepID=UPI00254206E6|nr:uncharacterized protein N7510_011606 [Penicillium lagena]KAJ5602072.1 hypothetical protein N7510_011606 [Penicillium lagena]
MTGAAWTSEEIAIIVLFASRGVRHETIADVLRSWSAPLLGMPPEADLAALTTAPRRTVSAIRNKLAWLRSHHPELWLSDGRWDIDAVVGFLYRLPSMDPSRVTLLLDSAAIEIAAIKE